MMAQRPASHYVTKNPTRSYNSGTYVTVLFISPINLIIAHSNVLYMKCNNSDRPDVNKWTNNVLIRIV